jgi:hypothetical protein
MNTKTFHLTICLALWTLGTPAQAATGVLAGVGEQLTGGQVDLTAEGALDWVHWGLTTPGDFDVKAGVESQISNYLPVGTYPTVSQYGNNVVAYTWSDGNPNPAIDATPSGIYRIGTGNGFEVDVTASDSPLFFHIYVGAWMATMHFEASLSDDSAPVYTDEWVGNSAAGDCRRYTLMYAAAAPGQTLKVKFWVAQTEYGNVTLQAASLEPVPPLSVSDPVLLPADIVAAGTPVTLQIQAQGAIPLHYQWRVDAGNGFVPIPNSDTHRLSVATAGLRGDYSYDVTVTDTSGAVTSAPVMLTVNAPLGTLVGAATDLGSGANINLTAEGALDWAHWGLGSAADFDNKIEGNSQISTFTPIGAGSALQYGNNAVAYTWSDGNPNPAIDATTSGIYMVGTGNGFEVTVPASDTPLFFHIYVGAWAATMHFEASLSDNSAPLYTDDTLSGYGVCRRYTLLFAAASPEQTLKVKFWVKSYIDTAVVGNVTLQAASLETVPPLSVSDPVLSPADAVAAGTPVTVQVAARGAIPLHYQWRVDDGKGFVAIPNSNTNLLSVATAGLHGDYGYDVVVTDTSGAVTSAPVTLTIMVPQGMLLASPADLGAGLNVDLTAEGALDWAHWGLGSAADFDNKIEGNSQISTFTPIGAGSALQYGNNAVAYTWSDGNPNPAIDATTSGIYMVGTGNGFEVTVPASDTPLFFHIYVGAWAATMHFEASLSDNSAPLYTDDTLSGYGVCRRYTLLFAAASPEQTLKVKFWVKSYIDTAVVGNVTLQAAALDPVPPLSVTEPVIAPGNTVAAGSTVSLQVQARGAFPFHYQWRVNDGKGFVPIPNSSTNVLSAPTAGLHGDYSYDVIVTNTSGAVTSAPVTLTVTVPQGILVGSVINPGLGVTVDLTAEGELDWAHWGLGSPADFDNKLGGDSQISSFTQIGAGSVLRYANNAVGYTWSDGNPNPAIDASTTGIYIPGTGNGFEVTVPASDTPLLFQIYVGAWMATMHFEASLSDNSAPVFADDTYTGFGDCRRYSLLFAAASPEQTLKVRFWVAQTEYGNVTLQAAVLRNPPPSITLQWERTANGGLRLTWPQGVLLQAPAVTGPWLPVGGATSPHTVAPAGALQFFRVQLP